MLWKRSIQIFDVGINSDFYFQGNSLKTLNCTKPVLVDKFVMFHQLLEMITLDKPYRPAAAAHENKTLEHPRTWDQPELKRRALQTAKSNVIE